MKPEALTRWTPEMAAELYGIRNWGSGYFDVGEAGQVVVHPHGAKDPTALDLLDIVRDLHHRGLDTPVLLRFADILENRIQILNDSFADAIREAGYQGGYRGVYPIKVNQKQQVISDILRAGRGYHHGLEAGSKAELIAAVSLMEDPDAFIICNGYKDQEFIDLALMSTKLGLQVIIVIEMPSEIELVLTRAHELNVRPSLGVRAKLFSRGGGKWDRSGGDRSKFGLNASQIIDMLDILRSQDKLDCLKMLHYHLGSQIADIRRVRRALQEASRFYVELVQEGAPMGIINVGGGLAVDYDGSRTNFHSSRNYSTREYAADVVEAIMDTLAESDVPHPIIASESGRATVAHHSVLLFNILHVRRFDVDLLPPELPEDADEMLRYLADVRDSLTARNAQEAYNDAVFYRDEVRSGFLRGTVPLRQRAMAEDIFWHIIRKITTVIQGQKYVPEEMEDIDRTIADIYYGNFSLFQSIPDSWAIDQLFPIMPIHRLDEIPSRQAVLADITCDSDGKVDTFIDLRDVAHSLPLHDLNCEEYYLGAFLVGAYQETLGDMHNLLGNVNIIHVRTDKEGNPDYIREIPGDSVEQVLAAVEYDPAELSARLADHADQALANNSITEEERDSILSAFSDGMTGYTYFEK